MTSPTLIPTPAAQPPLRVGGYTMPRVDVVVPVAGIFWGLVAAAYRNTMAEPPRP